MDDIQGIFAGVFVEPGHHSGALNAHDVNADVALGLAIFATGYAIAFLRNAPSFVIGSVVLVALLIALAGSRARRALGCEGDPRCADALSLQSA